jgi:hypothetical protein
MAKRSLTDILNGGDGDNFRRAWDDSDGAEEFDPLPRGEYIARIIKGELFESSQKGTPGYKLTFQVIEGDYVGRRFWHDIWLTQRAAPVAKRDLTKIGISSLDQLQQPLPEGIRCKVKLALRRDDDGFEYNRVMKFVVVGIDPPDVEPFAPKTNVPSDPPSMPQLPAEGGEK